MPTYQYTCTDCGDRLEVVQKFSDDALTECPACQGRLRKVFSAVGIVFKGSGFYRNDSRAATNGASGSSSESSGDSSGEKSASASADGSSSAAKDGSSGGKADTGAAKSTTGATAAS
ncbi:MAG: FmdB family zinc ribbon protein [Actinomycetota bacterium]